MTRWRIRRVGPRRWEARPAAGLGGLLGLCAGAVVAAGVLAAAGPRMWAWAGGHPGTTVLAVLAAAAVIYAARTPR